MIALSILLIFGLVFLNSILSGSEAALIAVNDFVIRDKAERGNKKAKKILKLIENPSTYLSTTQVWMTFLSFINAMVAADALTYPITSSLGLLEPGMWNGWPVVTMIVITIILSLIQVLLGELVPKRLAIKNPERFINLTINLIHISAQVLRPIVWFLTKAANGISRLFGIKPGDGETQMTEEEIRMIITAGGKKGIIEKLESDMITNVLDFNDTTVSSIMTHRMDMAAIPIDLDKEDLVNYVLEEEYSRFPVYEDNIDHVIGILHVKDLFKAITSNNDEFDLTELLRMPFFVPDTQHISELFAQMKQKKVHIAIVLDEYGGTAGMVTIEDLLEEIVGNILDEYDQEDDENQVDIIDENTYMIDALMNIDEVEKILQIGLPVEEYDTLSGFILGQIGRFPEHGEIVEVEYNNYTFEVVAYLDSVISKVKVSKKNNDEVIMDG